VTRAAALFAVVTAAAAVVAACAAREPRPLRPRLDPITRAERECDDGELDECIELGLMHEQGARFDPDAADEDEDHDDDRPRKRRRPPPPPRTLVADLARARSLYERVCNEGEGLGCYHLARLTSDAARVAALHARGCELKEPRACTAHALDLERGTGIPADPDAGRALMRETCFHGHARACVNAGVAAHNENADTAHRGEGKRLLREACAMGDPLGCHYHALVEATAPRTRVELLRLREVHEDACDRGVGAACAVAGAMYRDGVRPTASERGGHYGDLDVYYEYSEIEGVEGVADDETRRAAELFDRGCALGDPDACQGLFLALVDGEGVPADLARAVRMADAQCRAGHVPSCQSFGYFHEEGLGVPQDLARAEALYRQACDAGGALGAGSCSNLAELVAERGELEQAVALSRRGCDLGDARGCNAGGVFIITGAWPGEPDEGRAMIRRACELASSGVDAQEFCADAGRHR
jgi:TPR repeat protein